MKVYVLSPEEELYAGEATSVIVPGNAGQFEIRSGHAPIVSSLDGGEVKITNAKGEKNNIAIAKGFVEVLKDEVSVLIIPFTEE